jgi:hypothetical protein
MGIIFYKALKREFVLRYFYVFLQGFAFAPDLESFVSVQEGIVFSSCEVEKIVKFDPAFSLAGSLLCRYVLSAVHH